MHNAALLAATEAFLHEQIPITQAMGVKVTRYDEGGLELTAPLAANHNHLGTAFGGSLSAVATLAGYALLWLLLGDRGVHVVVREGHISYKHPVEGEIRAVCRAPEAARLEAFQKAFQHAGKARLELTVTVEHGGRACVEFTGMYVALR